MRNSEKRKGDNKDLIVSILSEMKDKKRIQQRSGFMYFINKYDSIFNNLDYNDEDILLEVFKTENIDLFFCMIVKQIIKNSKNIEMKEDLFLNKLAYRHIVKNTINEKEKIYISKNGSFYSDTDLTQKIEINENKKIYNYINSLKIINLALKLQKNNRDLNDDFVYRMMFFIDLIVFDEENYYNFNNIELNFEDFEKLEVLLYETI